MDNKSFEQRLIRLEENVFFQEEKLAALDQEMRQLRSQTDALVRHLQGVRESMAHLRELLEGGHRGGNLADPPPPHYSQHTW